MALQDHLPEYEKWRSNLKGVAGTSAGCVCALAIALGLSKPQLTELLRHFDVHNLVRNMDVTRFLTEFGIDDGSCLCEAVQHTLTAGGLSATSTLGDLQRLLRVQFACVCTDLDHLEEGAVVLSSASTPHVRVCDAIVASCAAPFIFCPQKVDGRTLVDGCLMMVQPTLFPKEETFFITHTEPPTGPMNGWQDYLARIVRCSSVHQAWELPPATLCVDVSGIPTRVFDLALSDGNRNALVHAGYVSTLHHLTEGRLQGCLLLLLRHYLTWRVVIPAHDPGEGAPCLLAE